jgi:hypothetical protein
MMCSDSTSLAVTDPSGTDQVSAVLLTPGTPRNTAARPSAVLSNYFEDAQNNDALSATTCPVASPGAPACDAYVAPTAGTIDRDRIFTMTTSAVTCSEAAATLAGVGRATTCGGPGNSVIAACKTAVAQLASCGCKSAASTLTKPPCYNVSNKTNAPKQCITALSQLDTCT